MAAAQLFAICCKEEGWAKAYVQTQQQQLYRLNELMAPARVPGDLVVVAKDAVDSYVNLYRDATIEAWGEGDAPTTEQCKESLEDFAGLRMLFAYQYKGHVMALCTVKACSDTSVRITGLYTAVPYRQRGFGAMLCYLICKYLREDLGYDDVLVFAETSNNSTNAMYIGLGFEPYTLFSRYNIFLK